MDKEQFRQSLYSALDESDGLEHHGVKGMHWGVRKRVSSAVGKAKQAKHDFEAGAERKANEYHSENKKLRTQRDNLRVSETHGIKQAISKAHAEHALTKQIRMTDEKARQWEHPYRSMVKTGVDLGATVGRTAVTVGKTAYRVHKSLA